MRRYSALTAAHKSKLEEIIEKVDAFVWDKASMQETSFNIASYSLKKALDKELKKKYMGTGVFLNYNKETKKAVIKKTRGFK